MDRVEIDIKDKKKFQAVALLIDRKAVRADLKRIKKEAIKSEKSPDFASYLFNSKEIDLTRKLLVKYIYPLGFTQAILSAAKRSRVSDEDVEECYTKDLTIPFYTNKEIEYKLTNSEVLISVYPYMIKHREKIILKELKAILDRITKILKPLPKNHPLNIDIRGNLKEMREWYWERELNKISTKHIKAKFNKNEEENTIDKGISTYRALINSEF